MDLIISIIALIAGVALAATMIWLERRPRKAVMPSLVPTTPVLFAGVLIALMAVVHLLTLSGVELPKR